MHSGYMNGQIDPDGPPSSSSASSAPLREPRYRRHPTSLVKTIYMPNKTAMHVMPQSRPPSYNDLLMPSFRAQPALVEDIAPNPSFSSPFAITEDASTTTDDRSRKRSEQKPAADDPITPRCQIAASLSSHAAIGVFSGFVAYLSIQLLFSLRDYRLYERLQVAAEPNLASSVATAIASSCVGLSTLAMTLAFLHLYMSLKAVKLMRSSPSMLKYMEQGVYLRFISHCGLFASVPLLLLALTLFVYSESEMVVRTVVVVALGVCIIIVLVAILLCSFQP